MRLISLSLTSFFLYPQNIVCMVWNRTGLALHLLHIECHHCLSTKDLGIKCRCSFSKGFVLGLHGVGEGLSYLRPSGPISLSVKETWM